MQVPFIFSIRFLPLSLELMVQVVGTLFTHHQKCVLLDTQASGNNRKITAFVGGLDLCDGRYDTPEHRLFRDLDTVFANDVHNPTFPVSAYCAITIVITWLVFSMQGKLGRMEVSKMQVKECSIAISQS